MNDTKFMKRQVGLVIQSKYCMLHTLNIKNLFVYWKRTFARIKKHPHFEIEVKRAETFLKWPAFFL